MIEGTDILFVLSGGTTNSKPENSLGGLPSAHPVLDSVNNLFDNIDVDAAEAGLIDYRCFYVFNDHLTDTLFATDFFIATQVDDGATADIGVSTATDVQHVDIEGPVSGGTLTLSYDGSPFTFSWNVDVATWAENFENSINALANLSGVVVTHMSDDPDRTFVISFEGDDDNRNHQLLELVSNDLTEESPITFTKVTEGGPINAVAPIIASGVVEPIDVDFATYEESSPLDIGTLRAGDGVPVWIRRIAPEGANAVSGDGFTFRVRGSPI